MAKRQRQRRKSGRGSPERPARSRWSTARWNAVLLASAAAVLAAVVYVPTLHNPFVYDDRMTVLGNPSIRDLHQVSAVLMYDVFRPVVNFSYAIDYRLWGHDPFGFHVTNLLLHVLNVVLVFVLALRLGEDRERRDEPRPPDGGSPLTLAWATAALFAVHPLLTEAVGYVSGRSELLCAAFLLTAFLGLRRWLLEGRRWGLAGGLACFVLALASKETAAMLPFMLVVYDWLLLGGAGAELKRRGMRFHLPFVALVVVAAAVRVAVYAGVEQSGRVQDLWHNGLVEVVVVWRYLLLLVLPVGQSLVHGARTITSAADPAVLISVAGLVALAVAMYRLRRRLPLEVLGVAWFFLLVAPSHVIPLQEAMAEHRVYTASCGALLALGAGLVRLAGWLGQRLRRPRVGAAVAVLPVVAVLAVLTVARNRVWADPVSLWGDAAQKAPDTWAAHYGFGDALRAKGRCDEAVAAYSRAIELLPAMVEPYLNRGICLGELGRVDEARQSFLQAIELDPTSPKPYNNLGTLAALVGRHEEARGQFLEALRHDPANVAARQRLAQLNELVFDNPARALELCQEIRSIAPATPGVEECIQRNRARVAERD